MACWLVDEHSHLVARAQRIFGSDKRDSSYRGGAVGGDGHRLFCVPVEDLIRCPSTSNFDNLEIALLTPVFNSGKPWNQQSI